MQILNVYVKTPCHWWSPSAIMSSNISNYSSPRSNFPIFHTPRIALKNQRYAHDFSLVEWRVSWHTRMLIRPDLDMDIKMDYRVQDANVKEAMARWASFGKALEQFAGWCLAKEIWLQNILAVFLENRWLIPCRRIKNNEIIFFPREKVAKSTSKI